MAKKRGRSERSGEGGRGKGDRVRESARRPRGVDAGGIRLAGRVGDGARAGDAGQLERTLRAFNLSAQGAAELLDIPEDLAAELIGPRRGREAARGQEDPVLRIVMQRVSRLSRIRDMATAFFLGDETRALRWLMSPRAMLDGQTPIAAASTAAGAAKVERLIQAMTYGDVA